MDSDYTYDGTTVWLSIGERRFKKFYLTKTQRQTMTPLVFLSIETNSMVSSPWSVAQLPTLLSSVLVRDVAMVKRLYDFALRAEGVDPQLQTQYRDYWCSRVRETSDPFEWLLAAHSATLASDSRLTVLDRLHLLVGVTNLRRFAKPTIICTCTPDRKRCSCSRCGRPMIRSYCGDCRKWEYFPVEPVSEDQAQHSSTIAPMKNQQAEVPIILDVILQDNYSTLSHWDMLAADGPLRTSLGLPSARAQTAQGWIAGLDCRL
ncbi:hypothetical protein BKA62DRAFT_701938, partial [Auriculariales sp. MPI-PUGE-AT-0066]